jgi:hypothetical protein
MNTNHNHNHDSFACPHCGQAIDVSSIIGSRVDELVTEKTTDIVDKYNQTKAELHEVREQQEVEVEARAKTKASQLFQAQMEQVSEEKRLLIADKDDAVSQLNYNHRLEVQGLCDQLARAKQATDDLQKKLDQKSPVHTGDALEAVWFEDLQRRFPHDQIERTDKGRKGADHLQTVIHQGEVCGTILWETKRHQQWDKAWVKKLHEDGAAKKASRVAIICTHDCMPPEANGGGFIYVADIPVAEPDQRRHQGGPDLQPRLFGHASIHRGGDPRYRGTEAGAGQAPERLRALLLQGGAIDQRVTAAPPRALFQRADNHWRESPAAGSATAAPGP